MCKIWHMHPANGTSAPELLTAAQVARRFNVSRSTVSRWTADGILTAVRIGTVLRYRAADVEALIAGESA